MITYLLIQKNGYTELTGQDTYLLLFTLNYSYCTTCWIYLLKATGFSLNWYVYSFFCTLGRMLIAGAPTIQPLLHSLLAIEVFCV